MVDLMVVLSLGIGVILGIIASSCYWYIYIKASAEGYNRGVADTQKAHDAVDKARDDGCREAIASMPTLFGRPVDEYTARKPLGMEVVE